MTDRSTSICQVYCNERIFEGWTTVSISADVMNGAAVFRLAITEPTTAAGKVLGWQIRPGDPIRLHLDGTQVLDGFVDVRQAAYDADGHGVEISGRSRTAGAIDAAAVDASDGPAGPYIGYKLDEIARSLLDPLKIGLRIIGDVGAPFASVAAQVGESVFEMIERLARLRGFHLYSDPAGDFVLAGSLDQQGEPAGLIEGINILSASVTMDASERASKVIVVGQTAGNDDAWGAVVSNQKAVVSNSKEPRYRPKVFVLEHPGDREDMRVRADRQMAQYAAEHVTAQVMVQGWRSSSGEIWSLGQNVKLTSPSLLVDRVMAIAAVEFTQDDASGTLTNLQLITPEAFAAVAASAAASAPSTEDGIDTGDEAGGDDDVDMVALWSPRSSDSAV